MNMIGKLDSQVIRAVLVALAGLVGLILRKFGVADESFDQAARDIIDALLLLLTTGSVLYAGYARAYKPTPPITETAKVATEARAAAESTPPHTSPPGGTS